MSGAENAKPGSRQVSAAASAPPSDSPATPTGCGDSFCITASSVRASSSVWRSDSMLRTTSAVQYSSPSKRAARDLRRPWSGGCICTTSIWSICAIVASSAELLDEGLGLHVAVDVEQRGRLAGVSRAGCAARRRCDCGAGAPRSSGGSSARAARAASGTRGLRSRARAGASGSAAPRAARAPAPGRSCRGASPRRRRAGPACCEAVGRSIWITRASAPATSSRWVGSVMRRSSGAA